uniref:Uncharacterized protein n=1 Tax=Anguilla anguilla TaxID=7936 RepID=A0A0E9VAT2_ANGAN
MMSRHQALKLRPSLTTPFNVMAN